MPVIAHNIASQFTNRQLNITTGKKTKSAEKLASGYKINRSADDAAGLQISEKMRSQIRGLNQASRNIQDGISLCQVADGALNESHAVLQRMRELSVQAANDTNSEEDRNAIQQEIEQLTKEVDRIANDTSFNDEIYPLNMKKIRGGKSTAVRQFSYVNDAGEKKKVTFEEGKRLFTCTFDNTYVNGNIYSKGDQIELSFVSMKISDLNNPNYPYMDTMMFLGNGGFTDLDTDKLTVTSSQYPIYSQTLADLKHNTDGYLYFDNTNAPVSTHDKYFFMVADENGLSLGYYRNTLDTPVLSPGQYLINIASEDNNNTNFQKLWIQMGAQAGQGIFLNTVDATAKGVGITDPPLDVTSYDNANTAISRLDNAINRVSGYRSHFGAQQNRLEYAKNVDDNTAENTQYAESRIRDADMAEEMVEYSKNNILEQFGQSMLAQANQSIQGILSLLG